jgi:signal transduction histidine kinase
MASGEPAHRTRMSLTQPATGASLPVEGRIGQDRRGPGELPVVVSVLHDLTKQAENERLYEELKRFSGELEERVRLATADLAEQNARLQWQSQELEKANRLKSEFLASMSHELRTPINALMGYTALLLDRVYGDLAPKQEDGLRRIQTSAQHLLALINGILDLAKIEAGKMPVHVERVNVPHVVLEIVQQIEPLVRRRGSNSRRRSSRHRRRAHGPHQAEADPAQPRVERGEVHARGPRDHPRHGRRRPAAARRGGHGIGIRAEDLSAIWEDFRQLDQSRTREYGGTGLGLSITRKLVERLGGEVVVRSEPAVGSGVHGTTSGGGGAVEQGRGTRYRVPPLPTSLVPFPTAAA